MTLEEHKALIRPLVWLSTSDYVKLEAAYDKLWADAYKAGRSDGFGEGYDAAGGEW